MTEDIQLLGNIIELVGFSKVDGGSMIVLKKIIGSYVRRLSDNVPGFEKIRISLESAEASKVTAEVMIQGNVKSFEDIEKNLFVAVDSCLKKVETDLIK